MKSRMAAAVFIFHFVLFLGSFNFLLNYCISIYKSFIFCQKEQVTQFELMQLFVFNFKLTIIMLLTMFYGFLLYCELYMLDYMLN